jgi:phospholipid/cholesterol/gamma-HCH transport system substrate-binding protein
MRRRDEVLVGVFLTSAVLIGLLGTLWLVRGGLSSGYQLYSQFAWGQNLKPGQPVLLAGVNVGAVADVNLRDDGFLDVFLRINNDIKVPKNSKASVHPVGIFGDAAIALTPTGPSKVYFQKGDTVPVGPGDVDIQAIENRADSIAQTVQKMTNTMNAEFVQAGAFRDMRRAIANTVTISENASRLSAQLNSIVGAEQKNIDAALASLRRAATAVDSAAIDSTVKNLRTSSASLTRIASHLDTTSRRVDSIVAGIQRGEGTIGKFAKDTLLYSDFRKLLTQADSVLADLKANPKKYINLRIF